MLALESSNFVWCFESSPNISTGHVSYEDTWFHGGHFLPCDVCTEEGSGLEELMTISGAYSSEKWMKIRVKRNCVLLQYVKKQYIIG